MTARLRLSKTRLIPALAALFLLMVTGTPLHAKPYQEYRKAACEWCGCTNALEAHHMIPQDTLKTLGLVELVNDPRVIVTLCDCPGHHCHLLYGHLGNYKLDNLQLPDMLRIHREGKGSNER